MREVDEELLQYIWLKRLLKENTFLSAGGKKVQIIDPGKLNTDSGPDFFNSKILTNGILLIGNIEIHLKSSDWLKHQHQLDRNYDRIILHVVLKHDTEVAQNSANNVEVIEVKNFLPDRKEIKSIKKTIFNKQLPCSSLLKHTEKGVLFNWSEQIQKVRSENKFERARTLLEKCNGDHLQCFYEMLLGNFGFRINQLHFEMLAASLPVRVLLIYQPNLMQVEALLLGMAGLLHDSQEDERMQKRRKEFHYLKEKHMLMPLEGHLIKFSRMRPSFFAPYKLMQFAALFHKNRHLFCFPQEYTRYEKIFSVLAKTEITDDWKQCFAIPEREKKRKGVLGKNAIELLIINTFVVFQELILRQRKNLKSDQHNVELLDHCGFENNFKTRFFSSVGKQGMTARHSQGFIQLYDDLCSHKKCMQCAIGRSSVREAEVAYQRIAS